MSAESCLSEFRDKVSDSPVKQLLEENMQIKKFCIFIKTSTYNNVLNDYVQTQEVMFYKDYLS